MGPLKQIQYLSNLTIQIYLLPTLSM